MATELLLDHIARHVQLSKEEQALLISVVQFRKIKKKQFLFQEGEICTAAVFVTSGLLRLYSIDNNGFDHILQFAPPGWWIGDINSFLTQKPATLNADAIEDTEIIVIQKTELDRLYAAVPKLERFF